MGLYEQLRIDTSDVGKEYGHWKQIGPTFKIGHCRFAVCECGCGKIAVVRCDHLRAGSSGACQRCGSAQRKHGFYLLPEYRIWLQMRDRCRNPRCKGYKNYGGRGIRVCERWNDFAAFYADMGSRPKGRYEIDRIDNNGDYCPENCRWVTSKENCRNMRKNRIVDYYGERITIAELSERSGVHVATLRHRLFVLKQSAEFATRPTVHMRGA